MELEDDIKRSLVIVMQRLDTEIKELNHVVSDIISEFGHITLKDLRQSFRNGSLGLYGRSFKLNTQEICFWIRQHQKSNITNLGI